MSAETLRKWVPATGVNEGKPPGIISADPQEIQELRRRNREVEQRIEILNAALQCFLQARRPG